MADLAKQVDELKTENGETGVPGQTPVKINLT
jgi:hypothetical protein